MDLKVLPEKGHHFNTICRSACCFYRRNETRTSLTKAFKRDILVIDNRACVAESLNMIIASSSMVFLVWASSRPLLVKYQSSMNSPLASGLHMEMVEWNPRWECQSWMGIYFCVCSSCTLACVDSSFSRRSLVLSVFFLLVCVSAAGLSCSFLSASTCACHCNLAYISKDYDLLRSSLVINELSPRVNEV